MMEPISDVAYAVVELVDMGVVSRVLRVVDFGAKILP
jgi:hypothetical protein